jgi:hypothetical protein
MREMQAFSTRRRRATTIAELMVSLALLAAASATFAQLYLISGRQLRSSEMRQSAVIALSNWMERASQVPMAVLNEERLLALEPTKLLAEQWPGVAAKATVEAETDSAVGKRVTLKIDWPTPDGVNREMVEVTAWRFAPDPDEDSP